MLEWIQLNKATDVWVAKIFTVCSSKIRWRTRKSCLKIGLKSHKIYWERFWKQILHPYWRRNVERRTWESLIILFLKNAKEKRPKYCIMLLYSWFKDVFNTFLYLNCFSLYCSFDLGAFQLRRPQSHLKLSSSTHRLFMDWRTRVEMTTFSTISF